MRRLRDLSEFATKRERRAGVEEEVKGPHGESGGLSVLGLQVVSI